MDVASLKNRRNTWGWYVAVSIGLFGVGCSRTHYRMQADRDAYSVLSEKNCDPRWDYPGFTIDLDPRSRYFDRYDPDHPPMPPDDPAAHCYMREVYGIRGWKHWLDDGVRRELENPDWRARLPEYVELTEDAKVKLTIDSSLALLYMHSPQYQQQLESLYLAAIDVTTERFRLDAQFFGGNTTTFTHLGRDRAGGERNTLRTDTDLQMRRTFATAGELLVGFANSFVWQFAGPDTNSTVSILNFSLIQPLLRGAGKDRGLENLTRVERGLLGALRDMERYRHGVYTNVAIGESGSNAGGVSRLGGFQGGTGLSGFSGTGATGFGGVGSATNFGRGGFGAGAVGGAGAGAGLAGGGAGNVGGYIGLLQQLQQIRNFQYSLDLQLRTLALLEANLEAGLLDLTQVDQARQRIQTDRANLLQARVGLEAQLETFKRAQLGLPPDLQVELEDSFIAQFQLIDPRLTDLQNELAELQAVVGEIRANAPPQQLGQSIEDTIQLAERLKAHFGEVQKDLNRMDQQAPRRKESMTPAEASLYDRDRQQLAEDFGKRQDALANLLAQLAALRSRVAQNGTGQLEELVGDIRTLDDEIQGLSLVQARARLEAVTLEPIELNATDALDIARTFRLDYMNARADLVDAWRLIAFNADQLQSILDISLDGDIQTEGDNPVRFQAPTGSLRASVEFDAPLTRLVERNNYRQQLIFYQQARRGLIQFDDGLNQTMRQYVRDVEQLRVNLELQRQAAIIAIRRVDFTRAELNRPLPTPVPGQPPPTFGPTAVQNLLSALADLSNVQNNFMSVWLNYYAIKMSLVRDLGLMELDEYGRWIERPFAEILQEAACRSPQQIPPSVPDEYWRLGGEEGEPDTAQPNQPAPETDVLPPPPPAPVIDPPKQIRNDRPANGLPRALARLPQAVGARR
jgi:hypothetical protein